MKIKKKGPGKAPLKTEISTRGMCCCCFELFKTNCCWTSAAGGNDKRTSIVPLIIARSKFKDHFESLTPFRAEILRTKGSIQKTIASVVLLSVLREAQIWGQALHQCDQIWRKIATLLKLQRLAFICLKIVKSLANVLSLFKTGQNCLPTLAMFLCPWANLHINKGKIKTPFN